MKKLLIIGALFLASCGNEIHEPISSDVYDVTVISHSSDRDIILSAKYWDWIRVTTLLDTVIFDDVPVGDYFMSVDGVRYSVEVINEDLTINLR